MNKKKALVAVLAALLICAVSVAGTFAYLTATSTTVTNTFISEGDLIGPSSDSEDDDYGAFEIIETGVVENEDGTYSKTTSTTSGNEYHINPGVSYPKEAYVSIAGKTKVPAYLFVEVKSELDDEVFDWEVDSTNWQPLMDKAATPKQVVGANGGLVYVYQTGADPAIVKAASKDYEDIAPIHILKDDKVSVKNVDIDEVGSVSLNFYAYLAQASAGTDAYTAYDTCF